MYFKWEMAGFIEWYTSAAQHYCRWFQYTDLVVQLLTSIWILKLMVLLQYFNLKMLLAFNAWNRSLCVRMRFIVRTTWS